eukprot:Opistho-2@36736
MVRFAPVSVPFERRLQTLAVIFFLSLQLTISLVTLYLAFTPFFWPFLIPYLVWVYAFDSRTPENGVGRRREWVRRLSVFRYFRDFFPIRLIKSSELDPQRKFIFAFHPHGIIGFGAFCNFGTEANEISKVLPGITVRPMTLSMNFKFPFYRDYLMALGFVDVSARSIRNTLARGPGNACLIVVGGAAEALDARPGTYDLTLMNRKGFVRMALENGADLVPVFSFGENDVYDQVPNPRGSWLRNLQTKLQRSFGFSMPLIRGRGIFNYDFGILPFRAPITTIIGTPIPLERIEKPTEADIDKAHQLYVESLKGLYDKHKSLLGRDRRSSFTLY